MEPLIPPALVLGCNTPHGINVLSDWIAEHTGIAPDFAVAGWADTTGRFDYGDIDGDGDGGGESFGFGICNGYDLDDAQGNGFGYGYRYGDPDGNGVGNGDGFGYATGYGDGYGYGDGDGNGDGFGYGYELIAAGEYEAALSDEDMLRLDDINKARLRADDGLVLGDDFDHRHDDYDEFTLINEHESAPRFNDDNSDHSLK